MDEFITHHIGGLFAQDGAAGVAGNQAPQRKGNKKNAKQHRQAGKDTTENVSEHDLVGIPRRGRRCPAGEKRKRDQMSGLLRGWGI